jgi:hypothetical protein
MKCIYRKPCGDRGRPKIYIRSFKNLGTFCPHGLSLRYFIRKLEVAGLLDIKPTKLTPTQRNKRTWVERIAKRLNHFLISEGFIDEVICVR